MPEVVKFSILGQACSTSNQSLLARCARAPSLVRGQQVTTYNQDKSRSTCLPVWPFTRRLWPQPCRMFASRGVGKSRGSGSRVLQAAFAEKQAPEFSPISSCVTLISWSVAGTVAVWKWWQTGCFWSVEPNWPSTPNWFRPFVDMASTVLDAPPKTERHWQWSERKTRRTYPKLPGQHGGARLVVIAAEVGRWSAEARASINQLAKAKARSLRRILSGRARHAWRHRGSSMLACACAKAFALSSLERRAVLDSGGATPSTSEVVAASSTIWCFFLSFSLSHVFVVFKKKLQE